MSDRSGNSCYRAASTQPLSSSTAWHVRVHVVARPPMRARATGTTRACPHLKRQQSDYDYTPGAGGVQGKGNHYPCIAIRFEAIVRERRYPLPLQDLQNERASTSHRRNACLRHCSIRPGRGHDPDLWPRKSFQQCPLTWWRVYNQMSNPTNSVKPPKEGRQDLKDQASIPPGSTSSCSSNIFR